MKVSMENDRVSQINRRLTILNLIIFLTLLVLISIEEYGQKYLIRVSITTLGAHHKRHRIISHQIANIIAPQNVIDPDLKFPDNFIFGVTSSAYQTEGATREDGRTPSTWDTFDDSGAENATNSYHSYRQDVEAINQIGISVSWNRIIPHGAMVNQAGIDHYHDVIDEMLAHGIEPIITLFHNDLPQFIQDLGGLTNPIFIDYFEAYAATMFENFGDKVKMWITFNEPFNYCTLSYGYGRYAPGIESSGVGDYLCIHNMLIAHATVYHLYKNKYYKIHGGEVGITVDAPYYFFPDSTDDSAIQHSIHERLHRYMQYRLGFIANPIFGSTGGYPQVVVEEIGNRSFNEGRTFSRLPTIDQHLRDFIKGTSDFMGLNYLTSSIIDDKHKNFSDSKESTPSWHTDSGIEKLRFPLWKQSSTASWLFNVPQGLRELLIWIKTEYKNPKVLITENGWCDNGDIKDDDRIEYFIDHLNAVALSINQDGCNVIGYLAKSLLDSYEWDAGYSYKFGLVSVNRSSSTFERSPKESSIFWREYLQTRTLKKSLKFFRNEN